MNHFLFEDVAARSFQRNAWYEFSITRIDSTLSVTVSQVGGANLLSLSVVDATFLGGKVGIYADSQSPTYFKDLECHTLPDGSWTAGLCLLGVLPLMLARPQRKTD